MVDVLNDPALSRDEREHYGGLLEDFERAGLAVFEGIMLRDQRRREQRAAMSGDEG